jgi:hypothetical protein
VTVRTVAEKEKSAPEKESEKRLKNLLRYPNYRVSLNGNAMQAKAAPSGAGQGGARASGALQCVASDKPKYEYE